jgi:3-dehydrotetronate 4-kinase
MAPLTRTALGLTLADGVSVCDRVGPGSRLRLHDEAALFAPAEITAPAGVALSPESARAILQRAAIGFLAFGNQAAPPNLDALAPILDMTIAAQGGFMAASFAHPAYGRTQFQGHLFQHGQLVANLVHVLSERLAGRIALITHDIVAAGPAAIRARLTAAREQGIALALIDAVDAVPQSAIREALSAQPLIGGPAWLIPKMPGAENPQPITPAARTTILSGALDRQTLFQLGAAGQSLPLLRLDPADPDALPAARAWASAQTAPTIIIATSAPPDRLAPGGGAALVGSGGAALLAAIAADLAAAGCHRFVLNGNDTASAVLARLGITLLNTGAPCAGLRWLHADCYSFLPKPGGFGDRDLFLDGFAPQIRLNKTAE